MARKHKSKTNSWLKRLRPEVVAVVLVVGALGLGVQARANLSAQHHIYGHKWPIVLAAPATPTPKPTPTPTAPPTPTPVPVPRVAVVRHRTAPVPAVKPAPNSSVNNLVPVAQPPGGSTGLGGSSSPSPSSSPTGTPAPAPVFAYTSSNWSGYLASAGTFTGVSGSWHVPNVSGNGVNTTADATWVGIGGVTSGDLIQTGTDDTVTAGGHVSTIAFWELLPASETPIPSMTVTPGDAMSANITNLGGSQWQISISDLSRGENFTTTVSYASSRSTAEWIEEDPSFSHGGLVPFDNFGLVNFGGSAAVENGSTTTLTGAGAQAIIMLNGLGHAVATPSVIGADGESFSVSGGG